MSTPHANVPMADLTVDIAHETRVHASLDDTFAALLEELGPANRGIGDAPMPMVLEAWPGGRWFRDLGNGSGHLWGHVQSIRAPVLLEIAGPLMMSFAVTNNVLYRLRAEGSDTIIALRHTGLGLFPDGYKVPIADGWTRMSERVKARFAARG